jgi:hypothetical protein
MVSWMAAIAPILLLIRSLPESGAPEGDDGIGATESPVHAGGIKALDPDNLQVRPVE